MSYHAIRSWGKEAPMRYALCLLVVLSLAAVSMAHDYDEVKEGRWRQSGSPQCVGYNVHVYRELVEQDEHRTDEYRFSQFGHRVVVTGLKRGRPRIAVLGKVSEEYLHFEITESDTRATVLSVSSVEILDDEDELEYTTWVTAHYADDVWVECSGFWYGNRCSGKTYVTGVPNFPEGYKRFSVKCTGTLEWAGN